MDTRTIHAPGAAALAAPPTFALTSPSLGQCGTTHLGGTFVRCTRLLDPIYSPVARLIPWIVGGCLLHAYFGLFQLALLEGKRTKCIFFASVAAFVFNVAL